MPLKAIVLDLDGTLLDQDGAEREALRELYELHVDLPSKPPYPVFLRDWRNAADEYLRLFLERRMGFEEQREARVRSLYAKYGADCPAGRAADLSRAYAALYRSRWRLYPDALPALAALQGSYRLAVITNGDGTQQRDKIALTGLEGRFERVWVSGDTPYSKPDPGLFRIAEQGLGLGPSELAYVGDRWDVDVAGAQGAGWTPVWVDRKGMPEGGSGAGVRSVSLLTELPTALRGL